MKLLVIGNGFDLAHSLPTQYKNFLDFVKAVKKPDDSPYAMFIEDVKKHNTDLYDEIYQLIKNNVLIKYFLAVYKERCKAGKEGWIDFESEISYIIQKLDKAKQKIEHEHDTFFIPYTFGNEIAKYAAMLINIKYPYYGMKHSPNLIDNRTDYLLDSLKKLIRLLEIYLYEYVEKIDCKYRLPDLMKLHMDKVLSFNYTNTYRKYYDPDEKKEYCYIHGVAQNSDYEKCNMVLGIDEYLPKDKVNQETRFVWFKKFYQRIYKQTDSFYLDWINEFQKLNEKSKHTLKCDIYIYGHSLDVTDKDILSRLILLENANTHIFYHNREAMAKQISNLVKVIGKDNLTRRTGGSERTIEFIQSQPAIDI